MRAPNIMGLGAAETAKAQGKSRFKKVKDAIQTLDRRGANAARQIADLAAGQEELRRAVTTSGKEFFVAVRGEVAPLAAFVQDQQLAAAIEERRREVRELPDEMHDEAQGAIEESLDRERKESIASVEPLYRQAIRRAEESFTNACHALQREAPGNAYNERVGPLIENRDREREEAESARNAVIDAANSRHTQRSEQAEDELEGVQAAFDEWLVVMRSVWSIVKESDDSVVSFEQFRATVAEHDDDPCAKALGAVFAKVPRDVTDEDLDALWSAYNQERRAAYEAVKAAFEVDFG